MRNLLNPRWLFIINTLPIILLFGLFYADFKIIQSLLDSENIEAWKTFGISLGAIGLANLIYALYLVIAKKKVSFIYGLVALLVYMPYIYLYSHHSHNIVPFSIPRWMISGDLIIYVGTFLMPTLAYAVFILVVWLTPKAEETKPWVSLLFTLFVPFVWYAFFQLIMPLWQPVDYNYSQHVYMVVFISGTLMFLFFLARTIYILVMKKARTWKAFQLVWKIPITILFPLLGLAINNGKISNDFGSGIFGDFSNYWFYFLAIINGVLLCMPNLQSKTYRFFLFISRSIFFVYTFYFFLVFLPYLPLSIFAVVLVGTGFLMLTPLVLFVIHINELSHDFKYLAASFSKAVLRSICVVGFLVLPVFITISYLNDRTNLEKTLDYLYTPDYSQKYEIDSDALKSTLSVVKVHKERNSGSLFNMHTPYLSSYFNWLVFDNLTLSDAKINYIEKVFFNEEPFEIAPDRILNENVDITNVDVVSSYDATQKFWRSWVNLELTNNSDNAWGVEYATTIELPKGCWVSDYYLYVGDRKESGILAEKKSAMWVFSQIRNENRDPGILYYLTGNRIAFRVFPFAKEEVRRTGIEFIHKEPFALAIDDKEVHLGDTTGEIKAESYEDEDLIYISSDDKKRLKEVQRTPYFHFLIDVSAGQEQHVTEYIERIKQLLDEHPDLKDNARFSLVNSYVKTYSIRDDWSQILQDEHCSGGYFLERAIKSTLSDSYMNSEKAYPVLIAVTDSIDKAIINKDFSDLCLIYPESKNFYHLNENGALAKHSLITSPHRPVVDSVAMDFAVPCREYKASNGETYFVANDDQPEIILKSKGFTLAEKEIDERSWKSGLRMQGSWISQQLNPSTSNLEWLNLVRSSFKSKVMTPVTSYLVVENDAQKAILLRKQEQVLSGNMSLDVGEDAQRMSEPGTLLIIMLFMLILWYRNKRKKEFSKLPLNH